MFKLGMIASLIRSLISLVGERLPGKTGDYKSSPYLDWFAELLTLLPGSAGSLTFACNAGSNGDSGHRLTRAGIFSCVGQSRRGLLTFRAIGAGYGDSGISAWNLVTELRQTHGSV